MNIEKARYSGILMHITSLPSKYGIGDLGKQAYDFADDLKKTGATLWQILPLGPTGYGNSPYAPRSSFAANELLISPALLLEDGYLTEDDLKNIPPFSSVNVEFDKVISWKLPLLKKAAKNFLIQKKEDKKYSAFKKKSAYWLSDYATFMVLYEKYQDARWMTKWDEKEARRDKAALDNIRKTKKDEIEIFMALQYLFEKQWAGLKEYVNSLGIKFIGDIPIFVGADSADTWSHIELFKTDEEGHYSAVSGVPPDNFSATGQLWGNPVYDWKKNAESGYEWWLKRLERELELVDVLRIDHFRGFDAYYEIKAGSLTAENGKWTKAPGKEFFKRVKKELGDVSIIAEDLGLMTKSVEKLRDSNGFPGMKIAQFGFTTLRDGSFNPYDTFLPHNYSSNFVAYTGTHDNDTTLGWYLSLSEQEKDKVRRYLSSDDRDIVWALIRAVMLSHADYAIIPMQDLLELDGNARMNFPSTCNDKNWAWRMENGSFSDYRISRFRDLVKLSGRNGIVTE